SRCCRPASRSILIPSNCSIPPRAMSSSAWARSRRARCRRSGKYRKQAIRHGRGKTRMNRWNIGERAARVHAASVVWDDHSGFMPVPDADLPQLQRWIDSGINYISIDVSFDALPREDAIKTIAAYRVWFEKHPGQYRLVERADDILRAKREGKLAI